MHISKYQILNYRNIKQLSDTMVTRAPEFTKNDRRTCYSKIGTKSVAWEYFSLQKDADGKPMDDGGAITIKLGPIPILTQERTTCKLST